MAGKKEDEEAEKGTAPLVLLVPYRDTPGQNRAAHLAAFLAHMPVTLDAAIGPGKWTIFIGEQSADGRRFSRGRVLNALARIALARFGPRATLVLHDIDLLPDVERAAAYALPFEPGCALRALNSGGEYGDLDTSRYIGGVAAMPAAAFACVNGFQNAFEGWGGEDDCLRDAIDRAFGHCTPRGVLYAEATAGSMRNLELDTELRGTLRARANPDERADKAHRRAVRHEAASRGFVNGMHELVFSAAPARVPGTPSDAVHMFRLGVHVPLPPGWAMGMSRRTGLPYFSNQRTGESQYELPRSPTYR